MLKHTRNLALVTVALTMLASGSASADVIAQWGPSASYVDSDTAMPSHTNEDESVSGIDRDGDGSTDDRVSFVPFSTTTPLNPASGYTGPTYYGGYAATDPTTYADLRFRINNDAGPTSSQPNDAMYGFQGNRNSTEVRYIAALVKGDFLNGADTAAVTFTTGDNFFFRSGTNEGYYGVNEVRAMVRDGSQWYVHENGAGGSLNFDPSAARWAPVALAEGQTDLFLEYPSTIDGSNSVLGSSFTDITGVAMYFSMNGRSKFSLEELAVDATFVPEPGTVVLLLAGGAAAACRRRRV